MPNPKLSRDIILAAIEGFEPQKQRIDAQVAELRQMVTVEPAALAAPTTGNWRKMSAAGRARIAEAQRKRWEASKQTSTPVSAEPPKKKRKLSAAGKRAIVEASKKRWAKFRAEAAQAAKIQQTPATKKGAKKPPVKASRKAAKRGTAKRQQKASSSKSPVPLATE